MLKPKGPHACRSRRAGGHQAACLALHTPCDVKRGADATKYGRELNLHELDATKAACWPKEAQLQARSLAEMSLF